MKKTFLFFIGISLIIFIGGCKIAPKAVPMDQLSEDGKFHYINKEIGFEVNFPDSFKYYQVQRKNTDEYIEIEFFVPTSDMSYPQEVQSYAKPMMVRFYDNKTWEQLEKKEYIKDVYQEMASNEKGRFFIKFWKLEPSDWTGKWSKDIEEEIKTSFKVL